MSKKQNRKIATDNSDSLASHPFGSLDLGSLPQRVHSDAHPTVPKKKKTKGRVEVRREKAGRGGKTVTTLKEFPSHIPLGELEKMTFQLKKTCACGGTLKDRVIELQGDVAERVMKELEAMDFKPVRSGG